MCNTYNVTGKGYRNLIRKYHVYKTINALPVTAHPMTQIATGVMAIQVRVNSLLCLEELIHTLDKQVVLDVLQTIQRYTCETKSQLKSHIASAGAGILPGTGPRNCLSLTQQVRLFQVTKETVLRAAFEDESQLEYHLGNSIFFIWNGNNDYLTNYFDASSNSRQPSLDIRMQRRAN